jgi:hypothetical protein
MNTRKNRQKVFWLAILFILKVSLCLCSEEDDGSHEQPNKRLVANAEIQEKYENFIDPFIHKLLAPKRQETLMLGRKFLDIPSFEAIFKQLIQEKYPLLNNKSAELDFEAIFRCFVEYATLPDITLPVIQLAIEDFMLTYFYVYYYRVHYGKDPFHFAQNAYEKLVQLLSPYQVSAPLGYPLIRLLSAIRQPIPRQESPKFTIDSLFNWFQALKLLPATVPTLRDFPDLQELNDLCCLLKRKMLKCVFLYHVGNSKLQLALGFSLNKQLAFLLADYMTSLGNLDLSSEWDSLSVAADLSEASLKIFLAPILDALKGISPKKIDLFLIKNKVPQITYDHPFTKLALGAKLSIFLQILAAFHCRPSDLSNIIDDSLKPVPQYQRKSVKPRLPTNLPKVSNSIVGIERTLSTLNSASRPTITDLFNDFF